MNTKHVLHLGLSLFVFIAVVGTAMDNAMALTAKTGKRSRSLVAGVVATGEPLGIHGAAHVGVSTGRPFQYLVPATGAAPLSFSAQNLPAGLSIDVYSGIISGIALQDGDVSAQISVADATGSVTRTIQFTVGAQAVGLTPILAWNPWYVWGCNINDAKIRQAADLIVSTGLASHGFNYINIDDCWQGDRDKKTGEMVPNENFPDMKALAAYVHSKGLRIGIYTSPNKTTCAGYTGSYGHIEQDVATYSAWGMDLIKYDWCGAKSDEPTTYRQMSDILARAPRAIYHLMCQYGVDNVWQWGTAAGGNSWRTNNDLADTWDAVLLNGFKNIALASFQSAGHWNDLDMLMVGKANWPKQLGQYSIPDLPPRESQLTLDEKITHMSLWSLMASPLIFSGDLSQVDAATYAQLTNDDVLAIDQDAAAKPARMVNDANGTMTIARDMADGSTVVGYFNLGTAVATIDSDFTSVGLASVLTDVRVTNLWTHQDIDATRTGVHVDIPAHGVVLVRMSARQAASQAKRR